MPLATAIARTKAGKDNLVGALGGYLLNATKIRFYGVGTYKVCRKFNNNPVGTKVADQPVD